MEVRELRGNTNSVCGAGDWTLSPWQELVVEHTTGLGENQARARTGGTVGGG